MGPPGQGSYTIDLNDQYDLWIEYRSKYFFELKEGILMYRSDLLDVLFSDTYLLNMRGKDPSELGFKNFWETIHKTKQSKFSDIIKGGLYA